MVHSLHTSEKCEIYQISNLKLHLGLVASILPRAVDHFPFSFLKLISCQIFFLTWHAWQKFSQWIFPIEIPKRRKLGNYLAWNSYQVNCFCISFLATWSFLQVTKKESVGKVLAFTEWVVALFGCRNDLAMARNLPPNSTFLPILLLHCTD